MPTVEKVSGGQVYIRSLGRSFGYGERADVSATEVAYLVERRGDFEVVDTDDESESEPTPAIDPDDYSVADLREAIADVDDIDELKAIREAETADSDPRTTALDAIDGAIADVED